MIRASILAMAALFALATAGTAALSQRAPSSSVRVSSGGAPRRAGSVRGPITTHGDIAMRNLEGDLLDAEQRATDNPDDVGARLRLSSLVYMRARITGDLEEMARAVAQTGECARLHPEASEAWLALAIQEQTLHRFAESRVDLGRARALGASEARLATLERELDWNAGLSGPAAASIRAEARRTPTVSSLTRLARLEHDLGHHEAADLLYGRALDLVDDTSPMPVAMLELQRGMNLSDAGRLLDAEETFRSAAARLPKYVAAREHLAEVLHRLGRDHEALTLYEEITTTSSDPEFAGALAGLHREHGRLAEAKALQDRATRRYEELLAKYPEAMAWHAAEFFAGEGGDQARARALLQKNAELRPNAESLDALARLERAAGATARADELAQRAAAIRAAAQSHSDS